MVMSLIYSSHCRLDHTSRAFDDSIAAIKNVSADGNRRFDITGFLFFFDGKFVQVIEGDFDNVANLYKCIRRDDRHEGCRVVEFCEVPQRHFGPWVLANSMDFIRDNSAELHVRMKFLNKFIGDNNHTSIKIRDLLLSLAQELQKKSHFPKPERTLTALDAADRGMVFA